MKLLVASKNAGKCHEIEKALAGLGLELVSLQDFPGPAAPEEGGATYEENAWAKAHEYRALTGLPALADDSGLEVEHLGWKPGVRSARFAGETASYSEKNEALLALLRDVPGQRRTARFICAVAYVDSRGDCYLVRGECRGRIAGSVRGTYGFGYDPIFIPDGFERTFGELGETVKSEISHRARALRKACNFFLPGGEDDNAVAVCKIVRADPSAPAEEVVAEAARVIRAGKLIAYPTDTLYGLGANALDTRAAASVVKAKGRPEGKPIAVIVDTVERARSLAATMTGVCERLIEAFWPGPLTVVVEASAGVPAVLTAGTGKIGVRVPDCPLARAISEKADAPVTATSANVSGQPPATRAAEIVAAFRESVSLVLDCGTLAAEAGSTVVDVTSGTAQIVRRGVVAEGRIREVVGEDVFQD